MNDIISLIKEHYETERLFYAVVAQDCSIGGGSPNTYVFYMIFINENEAFDSLKKMDYAKENDYFYCIDWHVECNTISNFVQNYSHDKYALKSLYNAVMEHLKGVANA